jgi:hypothetical protein
MPENVEVVPVNYTEREIAEMKADQKVMNQRIHTLERTSDMHGGQIESLNANIKTIQENTTWIKRAIIVGIIGVTTSVTGAIIVAAINGVFRKLF